MRHIFKFLLFTIFILQLISCGADLNMKKGDKFYALGEYYDAADQYKSAYAKTPVRTMQLIYLQTPGIRRVNKPWGANSYL